MRVELTFRETMQDPPVDEGDCRWGEQDNGRKCCWASQGEGTWYSILLADGNLARKSSTELPGNLFWAHNIRVSVYFTLCSNVLVDSSSKLPPSPALSELTAAQLPISKYPHNVL